MTLLHEEYPDFVTFHNILHRNRSSLNFLEIVDIHLQQTFYKYCEYWKYMPKKVRNSMQKRQVFYFHVLVVLHVVLAALLDAFLFYMFRD